MTEEQNLTFRVPPQETPIRLDRLLAERFPFLSRTEVQELIEAGQVTVDGRPPKHHTKCRGGEEIILNVPAKVAHQTLGEDIPLDIVYEDDALLVLNKPPGLVAHPAPGNYTGTLLNALIHHLETRGEVPTPYLVHRLDKMTSGLLVVAKSEGRQRILQKALQARKVSREYRAIVWGIPKSEHGIIIAPVGRDTKDRKRFAVMDDGRYAETHWFLLGQSRLASLLRVKLATGRTHQIRIHLQHIHLPVLGDPTYGGREGCVTSLHPRLHRQAEAILALIGRQALHARRLEFTHPDTKERMAFTAPYPADMAALLAALELADMDE